jgi:hypothetical protein
MGSSATLHALIDDATPAETRMSLRRACRARGMAFDEILAASVDPLAEPLVPGALLYCPAASIVANEAEARLWQPGVGTVYRGPLGPLAQVVTQQVAFARCGIPVPLSVRVRSGDPEHLARIVRGLGGLPVVVRADGGEGGQRVSRADSMPALLSLVDLLLSLGVAPRLVSFVPDAMHVRCVVVAGRAVATYENPVRAGDFRSSPSEDPAAYVSLPDDDVAALSVRACDVLGVDLGGVDVLRHPSGRLYLLEVNTPCYFPQAERFGADVAGPLVDALLESACAQLAGSAATRAGEPRRYPLP